MYIWITSSTYSLKTSVHSKIMCSERHLKSMLLAFLMRKYVDKIMIDLFVCATKFDFMDCKLYI